jgi:ubiquinone/menaquinone biosynthesis C-methylase UbiE
MSFLHPEKVLRHFHLSDGLKVADFGSGHGHFTVPVARSVGSYGRVFAIDVSDDALDHLRGEAVGEGLTHIHYIQANLEKERGSYLADNSVDRVLVINALFLAENKPAVLREALRVLHEKGFLILIDWKDSFNHLGPHPEHVFSEDEAVRLARSEGFAVRKEFDAGDFHYGILFNVVG